MDQKLTVRFWGVRGSIACPGPDTVRYGGNTPCVEVRCGDRLFIFDAGTGIRCLGDTLMENGKPIDADIFLSHCHIDHIGGLPFFTPLFAQQNKFRLWAGNLTPRYRLADVIGSLMNHPLFPITPKDFQADLSYCDFHAGEDLNPSADVRIRTALLDHPDGATGYRLEYAGKSVVYLTDNEGRQGKFDPKVIDLARGADLAIYDCTFTDDEIASKAGWGHSTWREGLQLADQAGVKTFCMFHHAPEHDDAFMDRIVKDAESIRPGTIAAIEGNIITL